MSERLISATTLPATGWHLNYTIGRYTAGCLWFEKIMGRSVVGNAYRPSAISETDALVCQTAAHEACEHPYVVTDLSYFEKPAGEDGDEPHTVLAKWYFSRERTVADGGVKHGRDRMNSESTDMTTNPVKEVISRPTKRVRVD